MELSTEPGSSTPLRRQIQFEQGYYWCHIVHQHQPEMCIRDRTSTALHLKRRQNGGSFPMPPSMSNNREASGTPCRRDTSPVSYTHLIHQAPGLLLCLRTGREGRRQGQVQAVFRPQFSGMVQPVSYTHLRRLCRHHCGQQPGLAGHQAGRERSARSRRRLRH